MQVQPSIIMRIMFLIKYPVSVNTTIYWFVYSRSHFAHIWKLWILISRCRFMVGCCRFLHSSPRCSLLSSFFNIPQWGWGEKPFLPVKTCNVFFFVRGHIKFCTLPIVHCRGVTRDLWTDFKFTPGVRGSGPHGEFLWHKNVCSSWILHVSLALGGKSVTEDVQAGPRAFVCKCYWTIPLNHTASKYKCDFFSLMYFQGTKYASHTHTHDIFWHHNLHCIQKDHVHGHSKGFFEC